MMPQIMIPELKLFVVTIKVRGRNTATVISAVFNELIFFPCLVSMTARTRIMVILTISVGWNRAAPTPSQRFFPFTAIPRGV